MAIGHHRDPVAQVENVADTGRGERRRRVDCGDRAAPHRRPLHRGVEHPREPHVESEGDLPRYDLVGISAGDGATDEAPVTGALERHVAGDREGGRFVRQVTVLHSPSAAELDDRAALGAALRGGDAPAFRGDRDQQRAGRGSRLPERLPRLAHRAAPAGHHHAGLEGGVAVGRVCWRLFHHQRFPIGVELLGHEHRQGGADPLPHLAPSEHHGDRAVVGDADPGVGGECGV